MSISRVALIESTPIGIGPCENNGTFTQPPPTRQARRRAVLMDDDACFKRAVSTALQSAGWAVSESSPRDLSMFLRVQSPDALIIEPNLPGCCWYSVLEDVAASGRRCEIAIVTAYPSAAMEDAARKFRAHAYLTKPAAVAAVVAAVGGAGAPVATATTRHAHLAAASSSLTSLARLEWEYLNHVLAESDGCVSEAARLLGIPRQTLYRKLRKYPPR